MEDTLTIDTVDDLLCDFHLCSLGLYSNITSELNIVVSLMLLICQCYPHELMNKSLFCWQFRVCLLIGSHFENRGLSLQPRVGHY